MALSIKNEDACKLAKELAGMTGESLTAVVSAALREKMERTKREQNQKARAEELMEIGKRCANHINQPASAVEHDKLLYDERGLPQ